MHILWKHVRQGRCGYVAAKKKNIFMKQEKRERKYFPETQPFYQENIFTNYRFHENILKSETAADVFSIISC